MAYSVYLPKICKNNKYLLRFRQLPNLQMLLDFIWNGIDTQTTETDDLLSVIPTTPRICIFVFYYCYVYFRGCWSYSSCQQKMCSRNSSVRETAITTILYLLYYMTYYGTVSSTQLLKNVIRCSNKNKIGVTRNCFLIHSPRR